MVDIHQPSFSWSQRCCSRRCFCLRAASSRCAATLLLSPLLLPAKLEDKRRRLNYPLSSSAADIAAVANVAPRAASRGHDIGMRRRGLCTLKQGLLLLLYHPKHIYSQKEARRFSTFNSANLRMGGCMGMSEDTRSKWASKIMLQLKD